MTLPEYERNLLALAIALIVVSSLLFALGLYLGTMEGRTLGRGEAMEWLMQDPEKTKAIDL